jgi:hypothetical protein
MKDLLTTDHAEIEEIENQFFAAFETGVVEQVFEKLDIFRA